MEKSSLPTAALICAIFGLIFAFIPCCCLSWWLGLPLSGVALFLAYRALGDIASGVAPPEGAGNARGAKILGLIGIAVTLLWTLLWILYFVGIISLAALAPLFDNLSP